VTCPQQLVSFLFPSKIFKFDMQTEEPVRDPKTGLCIEAGPNEAGEFMARIQDVAGIRNYQVCVWEVFALAVVLRGKLICGLVGWWWGVGLFG
jgi:hypothetical protein